MKALYYICMVLVLVSCSSTSSIEAQKKVDDLISSENFEILATWANPLASNELIQLANAGLLPPGSQGGQINLIGTNSYLRFVDGNVDAYLPFYGTQQLVKVASNNAIQFKGTPENYEFVTNERNNKRHINFDISNSSERYSINIIIYPKGKSTIYINSSGRSTISYTGTLQTIAL